MTRTLRRAHRVLLVQLTWVLPLLLLWALVGRQPSASSEGRAAAGADRDAASDEQVVRP